MSMIAFSVRMTAFYEIPLPSTDVIARKGRISASKIGKYNNYPVLLADLDVNDNGLA